MEYIDHYSSPFGKILLASNGSAVTGLWFYGQKHFPFTESCEEKSLEVFDMAKRWLDVYFSGKEPDEPPPLYTASTPFRMEVWNILRGIPYGTVVTYGEIAAKIAKKHGICTMSAQAVGGAVGRNPISVIIPCHRVLGADGSLTGYAGGIDRKASLLRLEGVDIGKNGKSGN